jgi:hypothetical protein
LYYACFHGLEVSAPWTWVLFRIHCCHIYNFKCL